MVHRIGITATASCVPLIRRREQSCIATYFVIVLPKKDWMLTMSDDVHMCPKYERAAELLGKKWTSKIVRVLGSGPTSFTKLRKSVDKLQDRVLSERLKDLEKRGVVERRVIPTTPVKIEYALTEKGHELQRVLDALQAWADRWETLDDEDTTDLEAIVETIA
jgi:DNA-binding HxlR family transcriptional regulator